MKVMLFRVHLAVSSLVIGYMWAAALSDRVFMDATRTDWNDPLVYLMIGALGLLAMFGLVVVLIACMIPARHKNGEDE
jgi:Na+/proline symporter